MRTIERSQRVAGFQLVEVVLVMALASFLLALGVPSLLNLGRQLRGSQKRLARVVDGSLAPQESAE